MKDYPLTKGNLEEFFSDIQIELKEHSVLIVSAQPANIGKWGMARLWRQWMTTTAKYMVSRGITMPLYFKSDGTPYGEREYNSYDAHETFTVQWLGVDADGNRLSWSRSGRDDMRAATKGERYIAMLKHDNWCIEKGIKLFKPRESEYEKTKLEQER